MGFLELLQSLILQNKQDQNNLFQTPTFAGQQINAPLPNPFDSLGQPPIISNLSLTPEQTLQNYNPNDLINNSDIVNQQLNFIKLRDQALGNAPQDLLNQLLLKNNEQQANLKAPSGKDKILGAILAGLGGFSGNQQLLATGIGSIKEKQAKFENKKDQLKQEESQLKFQQYSDKLKEQQSNRELFNQAQESARRFAGDITASKFNLQNQLEVRRVEEESQLRIAANQDKLARERMSIETGQTKLNNFQKAYENYVFELGLDHDFATKAAKAITDPDSPQLDKGDLSIINKAIQDRALNKRKEQELNQEYKGIEIAGARQRLNDIKQGSLQGLVNVNDLSRRLDKYGESKGVYSTLDSNGGKLTTGDERIDSAIDKYSKQYNVPSFLAYAIAQQETGHLKGDKRYKALSNAKTPARGVMQIIESTANGLGVNYNDLDSPEVSVEAGIRLISKLNDKYNGDYEKVAIAYNAGEKIADSYDSKTDTIDYNGKRIPLSSFAIDKKTGKPQTFDYLNNIIKTVNSAERFLGTSPKADALIAKQTEQKAKDAQGLINKIINDESSQLNKIVKATDADGNTLMDSTGLNPIYKKVTQEEIQSKIAFRVGSILDANPELKDNPAVKAIMDKYSTKAKQDVEVNNNVLNAAQQYIDLQLKNGISVDDVLKEIDSNPKLQQYNKELRIYARSKNNALPKYTQSEKYVNKVIDQTQTQGTKQTVLAAIETQKAGKGNFQVNNESLPDDVFLNMFGSQKGK